jgi:hypothetical protein
MMELEGYLESFDYKGKTYKVGDSLDYTQLHWSSDWNGDEVGYDDVNVVGLYSFPDSGVDLYVNTEGGMILEMWVMEE